MNLKIIMALISDEKSDQVIAAARKAGATGATVITGVRGEGLTPEKSFLGLELAAQRDEVLFLVAEPKAREILETIAVAGEFDEKPGTGIAFQIDVEDAVGISHQVKELTETVEEII